MADTVSVIVPALSALAGVVITQSWNDRQNKARFRADLARAEAADRRRALVGLVVATNQAMDFTRSLFLKGLPEEEIRRLDREDEAAWSQMFERYLEASMIFPAHVSATLWDHLQRVYAWRRESIELQQERPPSPEHQDLIEALRPWFSSTETES